MNLFITPHPPIIIKKIGRGEEKKAIKTINGLKRIAIEIKELQPETIAIITPHGNVFSDALCINIEENLAGDFSQFNHPSLSYTFKNDTKKANQICNQLSKNKILCLPLNKRSTKDYDVSVELDHGVLVPLHFINKEYTNFKLIHISIGYLSNTMLYRAGEIIQEILGEKAVLIVSGDLSHRLTKEAPSGFDAMGKVYDDYIVKAIKENEYINILDIDGKMLHHAGQCAQKPLELFIGALEGYECNSEVYSYEGPFGVGYMTAKITRNNKNHDSVIKEYEKRKENQYSKTIVNEDEYIALARKTINEYVKKRVRINVPKNISDELLSNKNGVFVSIKKEGQLRGCIGTIESTKDCIANEIIDNAIEAATRDPRFNEIEEYELKALVISVDILYPPEDIDNKKMLDTKKYGVIVSNGFKRGLLLPNLEGIDSIDEQIKIALRKANISESEKYSLQRFKVVRHE